MLSQGVKTFLSNLEDRESLGLPPSGGLYDRIVFLCDGDLSVLALSVRLARQTQLQGQLVEELALRVGQIGRKFAFGSVVVLPKVHQYLGEPNPCFFRNGVGVGSLFAVLLGVGDEWLAGLAGG